MWQELQDEQGRSYYYNTQTPNDAQTLKCEGSAPSGKGPSQSSPFTGPFVDELCKPGNATKYSMTGDLTVRIDVSNAIPKEYSINPRWFTHPCNEAGAWRRIATRGPGRASAILAKNLLDTGSQFDPLPDGASGWHRLWKGFGVGLAVTAVILLIGLARGARDPLQPLAPVAAVGLAGVASENPTSSLHFERVKTVADLQHAVASAKRPVMLDFYANWCVSCKEMEKFTFSDPRIQHRLNHVLLLQADVTANDPADQALLKQFGLFGPPGILFFDASGHQIAGARVIGYQDSARFLRSLDQAFGPGSTASSNHT